MGVIWPAILMGYEGLKLPYDVPANEYVNMESKKISELRIIQIHWQI